MKAPHTTQSRRVGLLVVGDRLLIKLPLLARRLNSLQHTFRFEAMDSIPLEVLGEPLVDEFYDARALFGEFRTRCAFDTFDFIIGVTELPITDSENKNTQSREKRVYFSLSDCDKVSVISANKELLEFKSPLKDTYQYVAYLAMCEVLINFARSDLMHAAPKRCLFDDCEDRKTLKECLEEGKICPKCLGNLENAHVSRQVVNDVEAVLRWCKKNKVMITLIHAANSPWFMLLFATAVALPVTWLIPPARYTILIVIVVLALFLIFVRRKFGK